MFAGEESRKTEGKTFAVAALGDRNALVAHAIEHIVATSSEGCRSSSRTWERGEFVFNGQRDGAIKDVFYPHILRFALFFSFR